MRVNKADSEVAVFDLKQENLHKLKFTPLVIDWKHVGDTMAGIIGQGISQDCSFCKHTLIIASFT